MPRRMRLLDESDPLHVFAGDLRRLRDSAVRRPIDGNSRETDKNKVDEPLSVDEVCNRYGISRASIYSALAGKRLPSRETLRAMVRAWAPFGEREISEWMARRLRAGAPTEQGSNELAISESRKQQLTENSINAWPQAHSHAPRAGQRSSASTSDVGTNRIAVTDPSTFPELARLRLGSLLQRLRKRRGIPVKAVGFDSLCSYSTISAVLRGFSSPSASLLERILTVISASESEAQEARRLLAEAKTVEQVYSRYSELRNDEMMQAYIARRQGDVGD